MAAGIAHEINNPLAIIRTQIQVLRRTIKRGKLEPEFVIDTTNRIESIIVRMAKIITGLRAFARDGDMDPLEVTSAHEILQETVDICGSRFTNSNINLIIDESENKPLVRVRPVQISQVLLNLLNNSYDAIGDSRNQTSSWIKVVVKNDEQNVFISVLDSGPGIPEELQDKIMQPFFTTKEVGKGTGLGLSLSKGIIETHGGRFFLDKNQLHTCFTIQLPRFKNGQN